MAIRMIVGALIGGVGCGALAFFVPMVTGWPAGFFRAAHGLSPFMLVVPVVAIIGAIVGVIVGAVVATTPRD